MKVDMDVSLMRLLHGELPESQARGLRERLARDPELAAAYARLERTWESLELPAPQPAPPGFAARVVLRAERAGAGRRAGGGGEELVSWSLAPTWVRTTAAAALALGLVLGASLTLRSLASDAPSAGSSIVDSYLALVNDSAAPAPTSALGGE